MDNWKEEYRQLITEENPKLALDNWDKAQTLKLPHLPKSIFKYREVDKYSLENLQNDQVWLASATSFNDPYDSSVIIDQERLLQAQAKKIVSGDMPRTPAGMLAQLPKLSEEQMQYLRDFENPFDAFEALLVQSDGRDPEEAKKFIAALRDVWVKLGRENMAATLEKMQNGMKVCSFSAAPVEQGLLMWGHYARWHTGFCIEYEVSKFRAPDMLYPVIYSQHRFDATSSLLSVMDGEINVHYVLAASLHKHPDWQYEDEWRFAAPIGSSGPFSTGMAKSMPTPKAVFLGSRISSLDKDKVMEITRDRGLPTFQMQLSPTSFALESKQI